MTPNVRERWRETLACLLLAAGIWVNTGTLAPLGATLAKPYVWEPCKYLLNIDHFHYRASFLMFDGAPRAQWDFSVALRRVLYFVIGYPFMKVLGFGAGGLVTNVLVSCASLVVFWRELRRRYDDPGERRAVPGLMLLLVATYPGWFYWAGTPYSYAAIVPASLLCTALLWRAESVEAQREAWGIGLALGVLFTSYDLLPFFGVAALLVLAWRRRWLLAGIVAVGQAIPLLLVNLLLARAYQVPFHNENTQAYYNIVGAYLHPGDARAWLRLLLQLPRVTAQVFLFSNFLFVPLLFLLAILAARWLRTTGRPVVGLAEAMLFIAVGLVFLFNNAAPPYPGWQLRGVWIARLYQPVLPAMLAVIAAVLARASTSAAGRRAVVMAALFLTIALDAWVVFAPVLGNAELAGYLDYHFYEHAHRPMLADNLRRYGARPVGFCTAPASAESVTP